jgi:hypothetical protein
MNLSKEFEIYMAHLAQGLGHADRHAGLTGYCTGLMLPLSRKSVEPMAARMDPLHASAKHCTAFRKGPGRPPAANGWRSASLYGLRVRRFAAALPSQGRGAVSSGAGSDCVRTAPHREAWTRDRRIHNLWR